MIKNVYISQQKYEPFNGHWKPLFCCWKCLAERGLAQEAERSVSGAAAKPLLVTRARVGSAQRGPKAQLELNDSEQSCEVKFSFSSSNSKSRKRKVK